MAMAFFFQEKENLSDVHNEQEPGVVAGNLVSFAGSSTNEKIFASQPEILTLEPVSCLRNSQRKLSIIKKTVHWDQDLEHVYFFVDEGKNMIYGTENNSLPLKTRWPGTEPSVSSVDNDNAKNENCDSDEANFVEHKEESTAMAGSASIEEHRPENEQELSYRRQSFDFDKLRKDIERVTLGQNNEKRSWSMENVNKLFLSCDNGKAKHDSLPSNLNNPCGHPAVSLNRFVVRKV